MNKKQLVQTSKFLSLVLRHKPETIDLSLDESGWADVDALLSKLAQTNKPLTFEQLEHIVTTNDKQRFRFNDEKSQIQANQGHSLSIDLQLKAIEPPEVLFHGTASRFMESIILESSVGQCRVCI